MISYNAINENIKIDNLNKFKTANDMYGLVMRDYPFSSMADGDNMYKISGGSYDDGTYDKIDNEYIIKDREMMKKPLNPVDAKLPKPVTVPTRTILKNQVLLNIANVNEMSVNDLEFSEQKEVLDIDRYIEARNENQFIINKIRTVYNQSPLVLPDNIKYRNSLLKNTFSKLNTKYSKQEKKQQKQETNIIM